MTQATLQEEYLKDIIRSTVKETLGYRETILNEEFDSRYKNVKLLMRNYRKLKLYYEQISLNVLEVEAIGDMQRKTGFRRWQALYLRYIDNKRMRIEAIANLLQIDKRTFYRDIAKAMEDMAVLLFGIESIGTWKHTK